MVIVRLVGGLGNQLFQYAAGRRLSLLHQTTLKLDISYFENSTLRVYSLHPFCIQEVFATSEEIAALRGTSKKGLAKIAFRLSQNLKPYYGRSVFSEPHLRSFDSNILKTPASVYLDGFWQSEKYFVDIQDTIRSEFTVKYEQDDQSREIAESITNTRSVSIHIRRGDYISNWKTHQAHGICSLNYYKHCVNLIAERIPSPHFFVFSDDPDWSTENLLLDYETTFVTHNDVRKGYEDLRLMSLCQHHIIANSTFSWWGAWLCANPQKIVIAPQRWFNTFKTDTKDLIPDSWRRI